VVEVGLQSRGVGTRRIGHARGGKWDDGDRGDQDRGGVMTVNEHQSLALLTLSENGTGSGVWGLGLTVCDGLCYGKKKRKEKMGGG
jgi:hypothetical protein